MSVFVIINEWEGPDGEGGGSEVVRSEYYTSETYAWHGLLAIARELNANLEPGDTNLSLGDYVNGSGYEEYYIQELSKGDN